MKNKRILVVDDEEIMRDVLSDLLESESYRVDLAENGAIALEKIRDNEYGVVLLDLMMPGVDGLQVLRELQKMEKSPANSRSHLHQAGRRRRTSRTTRRPAPLPKP